MSQDITQVATPTQQVVYESTSYDSFDRLTYNRNYIPERVAKVRASIKKVGQKEPVNTEVRLLVDNCFNCEELNILISLLLKIHR